MNEWKRKVAAVTGAASGIGRALAEVLGIRGYAVVLADPEGERLSRAACELQAAGLGVFAVVATDVSRHDSVEALADRTYGAFGRVDTLCNNAGICGDATDWSRRHPIEYWRQVLDVNLDGVINGIHALVPRMLEQGGEAWTMNAASMGARVASVSRAVSGVEGCRHCAERVSRA